MVLVNFCTQVLVVGGGDGGALREILKYKSVESVVLCEIDEVGAVPGAPDCTMLAKNAAPGPTPRNTAVVSCFLYLADVGTTAVFAAWLYLPSPARLILFILPFPGPSLTPFAIAMALIVWLFITLLLAALALAVVPVSGVW